MRSKNKKWIFRHRLNYEFASEYIEYQQSQETKHEVPLYEQIGAKA